MWKRGKGRKVWGRKSGFKIMGVGKNIRELNTLLLFAMNVPAKELGGSVAHCTEAFGTRDTKV